MRKHVSEDGDLRTGRAESCSPGSTCSPQKLSETQIPGPLQTSGISPWGWAQEVPMQGQV